MDREGKSRFDGKRLRKLQLERAGNSLPMNKEASPPDIVRRWNSMNETGNNAVASKPSTRWTTPPLGTMYPAATRPKYPDEPVVYVLPVPDKKSQNNRFPQASNPLLNNPKFSSREEENPPKWDLKYPHGMPRWGPRLVSPTSQLNPPTEHTQVIHDNAEKQDATSKITTKTSPLEKNADTKTKLRISKAKKKAKQKAVVEKAQAQSMRAAARAVQNIAVASPGSLPKLVTKKMAETSYVKPGLGSRLFGRGPKQSLLQSARIKQAQVMQADHHARLSQSLDDPLRQQEDPKVGARSVQSFEFLQSPSPPRSAKRGSNTVQVETVESDSNEDEASLSIDESLVNENEDQQLEGAPLSIDESSENESEDQQLDGPSESQSWSMRSCSSEDKLSIDETIDDSVGDASVLESEHDSESEDGTSSMQPRTPHSSSIPTMILSEGDPESISRHSDYSSLELRVSKDSSFKEDGEDEFFDAKDSLKASAEQSFDAKRCRELLRIRNQYLEQEEQKKLLSPQAANRLYNVPSLCRGADETTLLELATRSKWIERTLATTRVTPAEGTIVSPFSAAYPIRNFKHEPALASMPDDSPSIEPISLAAPRKLSQPVIIRKEPWHVAKACPSDDDEETSSHGGAVETDNSHCRVPNTTKTPFKVRLKRFLLRCLYFILFLVLSTRALFRLRDVFTTESTKFGEPARALADDNEKESIGEILFDIDFRCTNLSSLRVQPRTTQSAWTDMPILLLDPSPVIDGITPTDLEDSLDMPPPKCPANFSKTVKKFWENRPLSRKISKAAETEVSNLLVDVQGFRPQHPSSNDMFIVDMRRGQTFCDASCNMCFNTREVAPDTDLQRLADDVEMDLPFHLEIGTFIDPVKNVDFASDPPADNDEPKKPLLKSLGDLVKNMDFASYPPMDDAEPRKPLLKSLGDLVKNLDFASDSQMDDAEPKKPLLKSLGDKLRKHGQQIFEDQRKMRQRRMPQ